MMQAPKPVVPPKRQPSTDQVPSSESESATEPHQAVATPFAAAQPTPPAPSTDNKEDDHASVPMTPANTAVESSINPTSAPLPAMPRRAAPPRRKPQTKLSDPIPHVFNPDETPKPKTEQEQEAEREQEKLGRGESGAEGAANAGIATEPVEEGEQAQDQSIVEQEPVAEPTIQERSQPERKTSIPIPSPDHAHTEDEAQFRAADQLSESLETGKPVIGLAPVADTTEVNDHTENKEEALLEEDKGAVQP